MTIIYEPKGKALEYSPLAANIYKGCGHACIYCYAPAATRTPQEKFNTEPEPRKNILEQFEKSATKFAGDPRPILLSFTSDLYQPINDRFKLSRLVIMSMARHNLTATVLTKGGTKACKDFDILAQNKKNAFSVTLTTDDPTESVEWEPNAALPENRIESLKEAKKAGLNTWVSFEPVINPDAVIRLIGETYKFVDLYKVGKLNYHPLAKQIDWHQFLVDVESALHRYKKPFYIKKDLEVYRRKVA
jgi:DNA repair photolyase